MGSRFEVTCDGRDHQFMVDEGGGFLFHLLHCDACGHEKLVSFADLGDLHARYLKGLPGPYCVASEASDEWIKQHHPGPPLSEKEYESEVERIAARCTCGGQYRFDAPPRCPKCRSAGLTQNPGGQFILYD